MVNVNIFKFTKILLIYLKNVYFKFERIHLLSLIYMSYRKSPTLVPSKLCLCLPTEWPLLPFLSEEHCRITDSLHITRFCELSSDLDLHRIQFLESHYTNDRSFAGRRGVWLCVCKTVAPPPHTMFFFLSVCMVKMELKVVFGDVTGILDIFQKRELSSPYTWWCYCSILALAWGMYNCLVEPDLEIAGSLLLDLSSGLESSPLRPKKNT